MLARVCSITTAGAMLMLLHRYFPKEPPDARRRAIIGQFAQTLNAPDSAQPG